MNEKRILVIMETPFVHNWQILGGINLYCTENRKAWTIRLCDQIQDVEGLMNRWCPHGIINQLLQDTNVIESIDPAGVHISANIAEPRLSCCCHDHQAIGMKAAEYFLNLGYRNFAYLAFYDIDTPQNRASLDRCAGFRAVLQENGMSMNLLVSSKVTGPWYTRGTSDAIDRLAGELDRLPHPLALFTYNDQAAYSAVEACRQAELGVPDDVAILGVDNDAGICDAAAVPMSSIPLQHFRQGWLAARMLDDTISGRLPAEEEVLLQPMEVTTRASTSIFAVEDDALKKALQFIRDHLHERFGVNEICRATGLSRSLLDKRFRKVLNRSPLEEVHRQRIERVRLLLTSTEKNTEDIAAETGFTDPFQMYKLFRKKTGMTPREYRIGNRT